MPGDTQNAVPANGWVLYDESCGFCSWWVPFWGDLLGAHGFAIEGLQAQWVRERLALPDEQLLRDIRILKPDGEVISGPDVYRTVMRRVWWLTPLYVLSKLPLGRQIFDATYRLFNRNRFLVSRVCRMPAKRPDADR